MPLQTPTIEEIIKKAKIYLPNLDRERVLSAFHFADKAHEGQKRFSGEPYIIHPLSVAEILLDFHPDEDTLITALLHDVAEDTEKTIEDIEEKFGETVADLCASLVKLSKVRSKLNDPQVDNLRKLFLAMAKDFRVVLLKLCDRLHNMRTLQHVRPEKRARIAQETLYVFAPIAARLGIYRLKSQLEDLCFEHLYPADFQSIQNQLIKTEKWRGKYIEHARKILVKTLGEEGIIIAGIEGRMKSIYSIFRKMQKKNKQAIDEIFDVFAMRIILSDIEKHEKEYIGHVYETLGILHSHFTPLANRFKDYLAVPKVNGYRSLHTTVMGLGPRESNQPTEVQIRTKSMHEFADFGIAAHWIYEEGTEMSEFLEQHKEWMEGLQKIEQETVSNNEFMEKLRMDIFQDRIFVLTPRGDVKDLPLGASPVDFAYSVHTDIGHHCFGAKVNGSIVPLDYELRNGEVVEILTRKNAAPSQYWLSFVKTAHAKNRVRNWFRELDDDKHLKDGRQLLNEKMLQIGRPALDEHLAVLKNIDGKTLPFRDRQEFLRDIGRGYVLSSSALKKIFSSEEILMGRSLSQKQKRPASLKKIPVETDDTPRVFIGGEENLPYQFVPCCDAKFGDELIGYITRGRGVSIHKKGCSSLDKIEENRLIAVHVYGKTPRYPVCIRVQVDDRVGMMRDTSQIIADSDVNIIDVSRTIDREGFIDLTFIVEVENVDQLVRVLSNLEKVPNVRRAFKVN